MKNIAGYIFACAQDRPDVRLPAPIDAILRSCMPQFTAQTCPNITKNPPFRCRGKRRNDGLSWSDQRDLNPRPLDPQSSALPNCATTRCACPVALASFPNSVDYLNGNLPALQEEIYIFFKPGESRRRSAPSIALRYARNCMALLRISSARRVLDMRGSSSTS